MDGLNSLLRLFNQFKSTYISDKVKKSMHLQIDYDVESIDIQIVAEEKILLESSGMDYEATIFEMCEKIMSSLLGE